MMRTAAQRRCFHSSSPCYSTSSCGSSSTNTTFATVASTAAEAVLPDPSSITSRARVGVYSNPLSAFPTASRITDPQMMIAYYQQRCGTVARAATTAAIPPFATCRPCAVVATASAPFQATATTDRTEHHQSDKGSSTELRKMAATQVAQNKKRAAQLRGKLIRLKWRAFSATPEAILFAVQRRKNPSVTREQVSAMYNKSSSSDGSAVEGITEAQRARLVSTSEAVMANGKAQLRDFMRTLEAQWKRVRGYDKEEEEEAKTAATTPTAVVETATDNNSTTLKNAAITKTQTKKKYKCKMEQIIHQVMAEISTTVKRNTTLKNAAVTKTQTKKKTDKVATKQQKKQSKQSKQSKPKKVTAAAAKSKNKKDVVVSSKSSKKTATKSKTSKRK